eukprot:CAMPEP_0173083150 /NCGR_PEP_ID=MMETSP1102-20130122/19132_1 /TAXON_ID=49646 /ORGANISM="Geminigera sp., Strain Caron Lab Isolate" /LENGTH=101 /DNA_ID=CAMNT_0013959737 /DNA_START=561 /DNA_END=866 /DNA_ORIENTATION=+
MSAACCKRTRRCMRALTRALHPLSMCAHSATLSHVIIVVHSPSRSELQQLFPRLSPPPLPFPPSAAAASSDRGSSGGAKSEGGDEGGGGRGGGEVMVKATI